MEQPELTPAQLAQQDFVDNTIMQFLRTVLNRPDMPHDMSLIAPIRDAICFVIPDLDEDAFYPSLPVEDDSHGTFILEL